MIQQPRDFRKYIYHFTTAKRAMEKILPSRLLKFSRFTKLNDPKENLSFGFWSILDTRQELVDPEVIKEIKKRIRSRVRVLSFTEDYKGTYRNRTYIESGFRHPRMWDRYASKNKGVCLVFDRSALLMEIRNQMGSGNLLAGRVTYCPKLRFPTFSLDRFREEPDAFVDRYLELHSEELFFRKHVDWQTEHEYRILYRGEQKMMKLGDSLKGLILGMDFTMNDTGEIVRQMPPGIEIRRISYREGNIVLVPL